MATIYKVLGQSSPAAQTSTDLYTVPSSNSTVCSTIVACNRGASTTFRISVRPNGAALANQHYIVYDNYVNQYDTVFLTLGMTLAANDVVTVYNNANTISFSLFGSEITP